MPTPVTPSPSQHQQVPATPPLTPKKIREIHNASPTATPTPHPYSSHTSPPRGGRVAPAPTTPQSHISSPPTKHGQKVPGRTGAARHSNSPSPTFDFGRTGTLREHLSVSIWNVCMDCSTEVRSLGQDSDLLGAFWSAGRVRWEWMDE